MRTLAYIILSVTVFILLHYLTTYQPDALTRFLIKVDVYGLTDVGQKEQKRLYDIQNLPITYDEKQVLINHTVFMGASQEMVVLALGEPKKEVEKPWVENNNEMLTYYVYYVHDDKRPTVLVFDNDKLINAYKGSALDVAKQ